jgi:hypothetical protein
LAEDTRGGEGVREARPSEEPALEPGSSSTNKGELSPDASGDADPSQNRPTAIEGMRAGPKALAIKADNELASTSRVSASGGRGGPRRRRAEREASLELLDSSPNPKGRESEGATPDTEESKPESARADEGVRAYIEEELVGARGAPEEAAAPKKAAAALEEPAKPERAAAFHTVALPARAIAAS